MNSLLLYTSLCSAITPQVIDEFAVHRTTDIRESVAYLTLLTRQLQHHYTVGIYLLLCVRLCRNVVLRVRQLRHFSGTQCALR